MDIMLKNKKYIGIYTFKDIEIEGGCPALIDKETFDRVQEMLGITKRNMGRNRAKVEYNLTLPVDFFVVSAARR